MVAHGNYKKEEGSKGKLVEEEERKAGRVQLSVVLRYLYVSPYAQQKPTTVPCILLACICRDLLSSQLDT